MGDDPPTVATTNTLVPAHTTDELAESVGAAEEPAKSVLMVTLVVLVQPLAAVAVTE